MQARRRTSQLIIVAVIILFIAHWQLDHFVCNPKTYKYRPSQQEGAILFTSVFKGGAGTPAIFAMLGGQRYMVANILWQYADVLFHHGKVYEMVPVYESTVSINPRFLDAWTTYGWHLAWNLTAESENLGLKAKYTRAGVAVYQRSIETNPDKPTPYFDLAWLYMTRMRDYQKALPLLREVVENVDEKTGQPLHDATDPSKPKFQPLTDQLAKGHTDVKLITDRYWPPETVGLRLGYNYKMMGIVTGDKKYFQKAIQTYQDMLKIGLNNMAAATTKKNITDLQTHLNDAAWLKKQYDEENNNRRSFGLPPLGLTESEESPATN